ncbi:GFA family protein [Caulobacter sp. NIBR1757]|uniref:GFA family protein n=1 Tax=Caulobacter sp. NIBR1757 TaxID=3016000 RepID=UPI0022F0ABAB|nr:GFA family protein [Caulobacter sp. NIBR1757]WGM39034.1 hypothetical protein AMEJIAPC_01945 [Caulobacter sp. NIBR1757]
MSRTASCSCGALQAVCAGDPVRVSVCHCLACQQRTGSAFGVQARYDADKVRLVGPRSTFERTGDGGTTGTYAFCPGCGTTISWTNGDAPGLIAIAVGAFADPAFPAPVRAVYEERQHPWVTLAGIEQHEC